MNVDHSRNYRFWVNTEAITVSMLRASTTTASVANAKRGALDRKDMQTLQVLEDTADMVWNVPNILLNPAANGRTIRRDDKITDAASTPVVWLVVATRLVEDGNVWRCVCKRLGGS